GEYYTSKKTRNAIRRSMSQKSDFQWSDGYGSYSARNSTLGGDSFNGSYQTENGKSQDQQNEGLIDLSKSNSGQDLLNALLNMKKNKKKEYLENFIDVGTRLEDSLGEVVRAFGGITSSTSGTRKILGENVKVTIWMRFEIGGDFMTKNSDNQVHGLTHNKGKQNAVNGLMYSNIIFTNGSNRGLIRFEVINNPQHMQKIYNYLNGK
ncbi:hypothetical protein, partial [Algoriphagus antarcticus]